MHAEFGAAPQQGRDAFIEQVIGDMFAAFQSGQRAAYRSGGFAHTGRTCEQGAGAGSQAAAEHFVQSGRAGALRRAIEWRTAAKGNQTRKNTKAAGFDIEVVKAAVEFGAAHFTDAQTAP